ncbi:MAG TPA: branched-chain amino acid ABC transporter permease [Dehalococcoidia bacterium]
MNLEPVAQNLVFGLFVGGLYGIAGVGLSLVFGVQKVLNVAHGSLVMLGGYACFWIFTWYAIDPFLAILIVGPLFFLFGIGLHLGLFRFVTRLGEEEKIKNSLLISFGLTLVLENLAIRLWTADERAITTSYTGDGVTIAGVVFPYTRVASLLVAAFAILILHAFLTRTFAGKAIRATSEDWEAASLMGINVQRTYVVAFAIGTALAGIAGALVSISYTIAPSIGLAWTLKALVVVVLAGMGSIIGAFVAGILLGEAEALSVYVFGASYREVVGLVLFVLVLLIRPQGLFGRR